MEPLQADLKSRNSAAYVMQLFKIVALIVLILATTAWGIITAWCMSQSILPPFGGGWKCYLFPVLVCWVVVGAITYLVFHRLFIINIRFKLP